jgi:hypothetical protein
MSRSPIDNHDKQKIIWKDLSRFIMVCSGRRFGKSIYAAEWLLQGLDKRKSLNIYVAPTRQQGKAIIWQYLKNRMYQLRWFHEVNESELKIIRSNGAILQIMSAEKEDRFRGLRIDRIALDEFSDYRSRTIWPQAIRPCLSDSNGMARFLLTPKGFNMAYEMFQEAKTSKDWAVYNYKTIDSPFFQTPEGLTEIESAKANLSDRDFRQEYEGEFLSYSGRIYYAFDRTKHNTDYVINPQHSILVGQDFNRSPMASAIFQSIAGKLIQADEVYLKSADTKQTCEEIKKRYPNSIVTFRPDATGNRKTSNSALSDFDIIKSFGFRIDSTPANPRIIDRWASVNTAFEKGNVLINVAKCPISVKDREILCYKEGSCEADLRDPFLGHMSDAGDYCIFRQFPIIKQNKISVSNYL